MTDPVKDAALAGLVAVLLVALPILAAIVTSWVVFGIAGMVP